MKKEDLLNESKKIKFKKKSQKDIFKNILSVFEENNAKKNINEDKRAEIKNDQHQSLELENGDLLKEDSKWAETEHNLNPNNTGNKEDGSLEFEEDSSQSKLILKDPFRDSNFEEGRRNSFENLETNPKPNPNPNPNKTGNKEGGSLEFEEESSQSKFFFKDSFQTNKNKEGSRKLLRDTTISNATVKQSSHFDKDVKFEAEKKDDKLIRYAKKGFIFIKRILAGTALKMHTRKFKNIGSYKEFIPLYDSFGFYEGNKLTCVVTCRIIYVLNFKVLYIYLFSTRDGYERKGYGSQILHCLKRYAETNKIFDWVDNQKYCLNFYKSNNFTEQKKIGFKLQYFPLLKGGTNSLFMCCCFQRNEINYLRCETLKLGILS